MRTKLLLVMTLFLSSLSLYAQKAPKSPEAAIRLFMKGISEASFETVLEASACREAADNFNMKAFTDYMKVAIPHVFNAPSNNDFYRAINRSKLESTIAQQTKIFSYALLCPLDFEFNGSPSTDPAVIEFLNQVPEISLLKTIKIERIDFPGISLSKNERLIRNWRVQADIYGASEYTERVALFSYNDEMYYMGFNLLRYGSTWKVLSMVSSLANTSVMGTPESTTMESYLATFLNPN